MVFTINLLYVYVPLLAIVLFIALYIIGYNIMQFFKDNSPIRDYTKKLLLILSSPDYEWKLNENNELSHKFYWIELNLQNKTICFNCNQDTVKETNSIFNKKEIKLIFAQADRIRSEIIEKKLIDEEKNSLIARRNAIRFLNEIKIKNKIESL